MDDILCFHEMTWHENAFHITGTVLGNPSITAVLMFYKPEGTVEQTVAMLMISDALKCHGLI